MPYQIIAKWVGGILGGLAIAWIVYAGLIRPVTKPNPSTQQKAETIVNYNSQPKATFGCAHVIIKKEPTK